MMISTLEDPKAPRSARTAPDLLGPLALLALAGVMTTLVRRFLARCWALAFTTAGAGQRCLFCRLICTAG